MPYDGAGVWTRSYNFTQDKLNLIKIQSIRMDGEFDNYASGMNQVFLRNGVVPMGGTLKLGANPISGIASGMLGTPSISYAADPTTGFYLPSAGAMGMVVSGVEVARAIPTGLGVAGILAAGAVGVNTIAPRTILDVSGLSSVRGVFEDVTISAAAITGVVNIDAITQAVIELTANAAANWTFNIRGDSTTALNTVMAVGQSLTLAVEVPQGTTAYYCTAITIDGVAPSQVKWFGGAPVAGFVSGLDVYTITVIKTGNATFLVRGSQAQAT